MTRTHRHCIAIGWLALALLLAPMLGRMHQVVHGPGAVPSAMASATWLVGSASKVAAGSHQAFGPASAHSTAGQGADGLHALFAGHTGSDCQLLDQLLLGGALLMALVLPAAHGAAPAPLPAHAPHTGTRQRSAFLARAPPAQG